jgi:hypothetical protein
MFAVFLSVHNIKILKHEVEKGYKVIPFKMVEEINQDNPVKVLSKEEIVLFLQVQHAQGNIIYFPPMTAVHISFLLLHSEVPLFQDLPNSLH